MIIILTKNYDLTNDEGAQKYVKDNNKIYDKYVPELGSPLTVNLPYGIRQRLLHLHRTRWKDQQTHAFYTLQEIWDPSLKCLESIVQKNIWPRFVTTESYKHWHKKYHDKFELYKEKGLFMNNGPEQINKNPLHAKSNPDICVDFFKNVEWTKGKTMPQLKQEINKEFYWLSEEDRKDCLRRVSHIVTGEHHNYGVVNDNDEQKANIEHHNYGEIKNGKKKQKEKAKANTVHQNFGVIKNGNKIQGAIPKHHNYGTVIKKNDDDDDDKKEKANMEYYDDFYPQNDGILYLYIYL